MAFLAVSNPTGVEATSCSNTNISLPMYSDIALPLADVATLLRQVFTPNYVRCVSIKSRVNLKQTSDKSAKERLSRTGVNKTALRDAPSRLFSVRGTIAASSPLPCRSAFT